MRINLFVAVLEHDEVMKLWEKSKELSKKAVEKSKPLATAAVTKAVEVKQQVLPVAIDYTVRGFMKLSDLSNAAGEYLNSKKKGARA